MKSSKRDNVEGKLHQAKGKTKETLGKIVGSHDLESDGQDEHLAGEVQEKVGKVKKVVGK